jgi:hypothetical protein
VHLRETPERSATAYAGVPLGKLLVDFSAARRTISPHLSASENETLFGISAASTITIIGATYSCANSIPPERHLGRSGNFFIDSLIPNQLDHKNLNGMSMHCAGNRLRPSHWSAILQSEPASRYRVRLHERDDFFGSLE